jgi:hypothetical protein
MGIRMARAETGVAEERGPRFGITEREGDVRCWSRVDQQDREGRRETLFYFGEEHLVGKFPCLNFTYPPDKTSMKMKTSQLRKLLASNKDSKISENNELVFLNMGVNV